MRTPTEERRRKGGASPPYPATPRQTNVEGCRSARRGRRARLQGCGRGRVRGALPCVWDDLGYTHTRGPPRRSAPPPPRRHPPRPPYPPHRKHRITHRKRRKNGNSREKSSERRREEKPRKMGLEGITPTAARGICDNNAQISMISTTYRNLLAIFSQSRHPTPTRQIRDAQASAKS